MIPHWPISAGVYQLVHWDCSLVFSQESRMSRTQERRGEGSTIRPLGWYSMVHIFIFSRLMLLHSDYSVMLVTTVSLQTHPNSTGYDLQIELQKIPLEQVPGRVLSNTVLESHTMIKQYFVATWSKMVPQLKSICDEYH